MIKHFEKVYGRKPKAILDVGAGSGHFVYACKQLGIRADGIELSNSGRQFSKNVFGVELMDADFYSQWEQFSDYEVISFWGVIEHTPFPTKANGFWFDFFFPYLFLLVTLFEKLVLRAQEELGAVLWICFRSGLGKQKSDVDFRKSDVDFPFLTKIQ